MNQEKIIDEFKRCKKDPIHFICNYVKIVHPVLGTTNFNLFPFQKRIVKNLLNHRFNLLRKFRQAGATTIACAVGLWLSVFHKNKTVVILSIGDTESTEVLERIKLMYDELPAFLKPGLLGDNKHTLKLLNGSTIKSRPSSRTAGRSLAGSLLIIDEAAFIENIEKLWESVYPILSTGGRAFVLSTVNGTGNWFYKLYKGAKNNENSFNAVDINWREHPMYFRTDGYQWLYDVLEKQNPPICVDKWMEVTKSNLSFKSWRQEYECIAEDTIITLRDKETGEIKEIMIGEAYKCL